MLCALAARQAAPQLLAAVRAGACGAFASGVLRRGLAAMVEPTAFPPADRDSFHYAVLQAPLMKAGAVCVVVLSIMRPEHPCCPACFASFGLVQEETGGSRPRFPLHALRRQRLLPSFYFHHLATAGGDGWQPVPLPAAVHQGPMLPSRYFHHPDCCSYHHPQCRRRLAGACPDSCCPTWRGWEAWVGCGHRTEASRPTRCGGAGQRLPLPGS